MKRSILVAVVPLITLVACAEPTAPPAASDELAPAFHLSTRQIYMLDECDPNSFNQVIGPGTCINRNGGLTFDKFVAQLERHGTAQSWRFNPSVINVPSTTTLDVVNSGGEEHTFTEVAQFGGGFIGFLNFLTGNLVPAPECVNPADPTVPNANLVFVPSGGHDHVTLSPGVQKKFMCCIHPWMRAQSQ